MKDVMSSTIVSSLGKKFLHFPCTFFCDGIDVKRPNLEVEKCGVFVQRAITFLIIVIETFMNHL